MVKLGTLERKIHCKKARIRLFIMENPLCTFVQILQNGKITTNKIYLKKYLDELIKAKSVFKIPFQDKFLAFPIIADRRNEISIALLAVLIDDTIGSNSEIRTNKLFKSVYETKNVEYLYFEKTNNHPLSERVLAKNYILWKLKLRIFHLDLKKVITKQTPSQTWKKIQDNGDNLLTFGKELHSFLEVYNSQSHKVLEKLEKEFDMEYEMDVIYLNKLSYHTRPLYEILEVAVANLMLGTKGASKVHLKLRRISSYKHGALPETKRRKDLDKKLQDLRNTSTISKQIESFEKRYAKLIQIEPRKYPRKMTNTKILIGKITNSQGIPDENKLISSYLSELGRINITETPYKFIKLYLNLWGLRKFMNNAPDTPKNTVIKGRIQSIFNKLQGDG